MGDLMDGTLSAKQGGTNAQMFLCPLRNLSGCRTSSRRLLPELPAVPIKQLASLMKLSLAEGSKAARGHAVLPTSRGRERGAYMLVIDGAQAGHCSLQPGPDRRRSKRMN